MTEDTQSHVNPRLIFINLWENRIWLYVGSISGLGVALIISLILISPIYRSEAILLPTDKSTMSSLDSLISQYGGLASFAGVDLSSEDAGSHASVAIETIRSRKFVKYFTQKYDILPLLMAVDGWELVSDTPQFNNDDYIESQKKWIRDVEFPDTVVPSLSEYHERFGEIITISEDEDTGFVKLTVEYYSPSIAREWAENIIQEINGWMLDRDVEQASRSIEYITQQINNTSIPELNKAFFNIIEEQHKIIMLAYSQPEYVFEVIDPPIEDYEIIFPNYIWFIISGTMVGLFLPVVILSSLLFYTREIKSN